MVLLLDRGESEHPLDLVEVSVAARDWACERTARNELVAEVHGRWCNYYLVFVWSDELDALNIACAFDVRSPKERQAAVYELLAITNDRLTIGHFEVSSGLPAFRHSLLLRGANLSAEQVEDMVDIALSEVDRFYPAFQYVAWGGRNPPEALAASMLETKGEA